MRASGCGDRGRAGRIAGGWSRSVAQGSGGARPATRPGIARRSVLGVEVLDGRRARRTVPMAALERGRRLRAPRTRGRGAGARRRRRARGRGSDARSPSASRTPCANPGSSRIATPRRNAADATSPDARAARPPANASAAAADAGPVAGCGPGSRGRHHDPRRHGIRRPDRAPRHAREDRVQRPARQLDRVARQPPRLRRPPERGDRLRGDDVRDRRLEAAPERRVRRLARPGEVAGPPAHLREVEQRRLVEAAPSRRGLELRAGERQQAQAQVERREAEARRPGQGAASGPPRSDPGPESGDAAGADVSVTAAAGGGAPARAGSGPARPPPCAARPRGPAGRPAPARRPA